jgi:hypothetical protein
VLSPQPTDVRLGNDVLGQIFGSKDVSCSVAQSACAQTGLDAGMLKQMLPMLAMLVAGYMAKQGLAALSARLRKWSGWLGGNARWPAGGWRRCCPRAAGRLLVALAVWSPCWT